MTQLPVVSVDVGDVPEVLDGVTPSVCVPWPEPWGSAAARAQLVTTLADHLSEILATRVRSNGRSFSERIRLDRRPAPWKTSTARSSPRPTPGAELTLPDRSWTDRSVRRRGGQPGRGRSRLAGAGFRPPRPRAPRSHRRESRRGQTHAASLATSATISAASTTASDRTIGPAHAMSYRRQAAPSGPAVVITTATR